MAVVVLRVVGRVSNNGAKAKAESEEDLRCSLPPHLNVCPNFQLCKREQERQRCVGKILETQKHWNISLLNRILFACTFG